MNKEMKIQTQYLLFIAIFIFVNLINQGEIGQKFFDTVTNSKPVVNIGQFIMPDIWNLNQNQLAIMGYLVNEYNKGESNCCNVKPKFYVNPGDSDFDPVDIALKIAGIGTEGGSATRSHIAINPQYSSKSLLMQPVFTKYRIPQATWANESTELASKNVSLGNGTFFRPVANNFVVVETILSFMKTNGLTKIYLITGIDAFDKNISDLIEQNHKIYGVSIVQRFNQASASKFSAAQAKSIGSEIIKQLTRVIQCACFGQEFNDLAKHIKQYNLIDTEQLWLGPSSLPPNNEYIGPGFIVTQIWSPSGEQESSPKIETIVKQMHTKAGLTLPDHYEDSQNFQAYDMALFILKILNWTYTANGGEMNADVSFCNKFMERVKSYTLPSNLSKTGPLSILPNGNRDGRISIVMYNGTSSQTYQGLQKIQGEWEITWGNRNISFPKKSVDTKLSDFIQQSENYFISCDPGSQFDPIRGCTLCSRGFFNPWMGETKCRVCSKGSFTNIQGSTHCVKCPSGQYSRFEESFRCEPCNQESQNPYEGESQCISCSENSMTLQPRSTSITDCYCEKGYQRKLEGETCLKCMADATCQGGIKEAQIIPKKGQWVDNQNPQLLQKCLPQRCTGGGCLLDNKCKGEGQYQCEKGFIGPLCAHCNRNHVYTNGSCKSCDNLSHVSRLSIVTLLLLIVAIGLIINAKNNSVYKYQLNRDIYLYLEVIIVYLQLLGVLKKLKINIHSIATSLFQSFSLINFDITAFGGENIDFINLDCIQGESLKYMHVVQNMFYPISLVSFIQIISFVRYIFKKMTKNRAKKLQKFMIKSLPNMDEAATCMVVVLDFCLIIMTQQSWSIFDCQQQPYMLGENAYHYTQSNDSSIFCFSPEWQQIFYIHIGFILFQCFFPVLFKFQIQYNEQYFSQYKTNKYGTCQTNQKQQWEKLQTATMLDNRPGEGIQTHIMMIQKMLVPLLIAFLGEQLSFLLTLLAIQSMAKAQQIALRRPQGSISLNNVTIIMSFCNAIIYACIAFFDNLEEQKMHKNQQLTTSIVLVLILMIIVIALPIIIWSYQFLKKCVYVQQILNEDNWKGKQIKEKFSLIEKKNNTKKLQKEEIEKQCRIISDNLKSYDSINNVNSIDSINKISIMTSNADFEANFDLVTEQDLLNVHRSTKFVISSAKSDLIRNVIKGLKTQKYQEIQRDNESRNRKTTLTKQMFADVVHDNNSSKQSAVSGDVKEEFGHINLSQKTIEIQGQHVENKTLIIPISDPKNQ